MTRNTVCMCAALLLLLYMVLLFSNLGLCQSLKQTDDVVY